MEIDWPELSEGFKWYDFGGGNRMMPAPEQGKYPSGYVIGIERTTDNAIQLGQFPRSMRSSMPYVASIVLEELKQQGSPDYLNGGMIPCVTIPSASHSPQS